MKTFLILLTSIVLLAGGLWYKATHNLAYKMAAEYPGLQKICDSVGGCWAVHVTCEKYDNKGNTSLRNTTWWEIEAVPFTRRGIVGYGYGPTVGLDNHAAINRAIEDYWDRKKQQEAIGSNFSPYSVVYPDSSPCDKDCWK